MRPLGGDPPRGRLFLVCAIWESGDARLWVDEKVIPVEKGAISRVAGHVAMLNHQVQAAMAHQAVGIENAQLLAARRWVQEPAMGREQ